MNDEFSSPFPFWNATIIVFRKNFQTIYEFDYFEKKNGKRIFYVSKYSILVINLTYFLKLEKLTFKK